jgi:hypothetical protein
MRAPYEQTGTTFFRIRSKSNSALLFISFGFLFLLGSAALSHQENTSQKVRVAEGQYRVYKQTNAGGIGPFATGVFNFTESWTLWRSADGSWEVEGNREYESPSDDAHNNRFTVHLSPDFRVARLEEFRTLRWRPNSGPLSCEFLPARLICKSGVELDRNTLLDLPLKDAYGFLWPISAFSLSHITRFAPRTPMSVIPVQMLSVDEPSMENPLSASVPTGQLKYLGHESITVADRKWLADKFELNVPLHAPFLIWTSPAGLLLDFAEEDNQGRQREQGINLVHYQQFADF